MEATLHALGGILLKAVPTFLLLFLLQFYLKLIFFRPLEKVLKERYEATEGARKLAERSMERAAQKTAEYEAALRAARAEAYQAQEQLYREMQERQSADVATARQNAENAVKEARAQLATNLETARVALAHDAERLADQITETLLRRSAA